ncbi:MAG TPA: type II toxin-antitoxin system Phd/YefM family antitoxin [Geminicoccus sp.]|uniref:type II toxin-antitoxin system Phd/YefM family antitoxin n=1 Tax=Geminicoccus sp. TaxID=2024832 RepID=UPI002BA5E8AB|nr:type II toxin-antitoxin system Phd/YefM family antitoxin [Geminicoccus sp.]HWL68459.1 type II toxin-antitoxin system Phd/YefM family antitoxin [Geminicoccus sp.]
MAITTLSSRAFNQDVGKAKRAAKDGPVFITDRGKEAYVLLTIDEYRRIAGEERSILDVLAQKSDLEFDFDPPRMDDEFFRPAELD